MANWVSLINPPQPKKTKNKDVKIPDLRSGSKKLPQKSAKMRFFWDVASYVFFFFFFFFFFWGGGVGFPPILETMFQTEIQHF